MANTRDLINKVLVGLRQTQIDSGTTSTTDAYELLVLQFVNEAKEEVEESWDWQALRDAVTITLSQGTATYTLTTSGAASVDTNDRTRLMYDDTPVGRLPQVFVTSETSEYRLKEISRERMQGLHLTDDDEQDQPEFFTIYSNGTSLNMQIYPVPDGAHTLTGRFVIPQDELSSTNLSTNLTVPERPVWTKALWKANEERGSELARPEGPNERAYRVALGNAIGREMTDDDITGRPV